MTLLLSPHTHTQKHKQAYDLENLHTHRQRLNSGIRSKKLEILVSVAAIDKLWWTCKI